MLSWHGACVQSIVHLTARMPLHAHVHVCRVVVPGIGKQQSLLSWQEFDWLDNKDGSKARTRYGEGSRLQTMESILQGE